MAMAKACMTRPPRDGSRAYSDAKRCNKRRGFGERAARILKVEERRWEERRKGEG
jgi:hypothetical protein